MREAVRDDGLVIADYAEKLEDLGNPAASMLAI